MSGPEIPTPEQVVQRFTTEQMIGLFQEIGYRVTPSEMEDLKKQVLKLESVEQAFQEFLDKRDSSA
jgi:hypothetical protein